MSEAHGSSLLKCCVFLYFTFLSALTAAINTASASPWARPKHELITITRAEYFRSDLGLLSVSNQDVPGFFERLDSDSYIEYGVTDTITVIGKARYGTGWLTRGTTVISETGFSEIAGFVQQQVFRNEKHAGAIKLGLSAYPGLDTVARPAFYAESIDLEIGASYGRDITPTPFKTFAATELTYRKRIGDAADQLHSLSTFGIEPSSRLLLLVDFIAIKSLGNEQLGGVNYDVVKLQPSVAWRIRRRFRIHFGASREIAGRNLQLGSNYFIGVSAGF